MPSNARTGRRYRGLNVLALWSAAQAHGYVDARWATYQQWAALGAQVRKAERGTLMMFYKDLPHCVSSEADGAPFVACAAYVFNAAQVDAAPPAASHPTDTLPPAPFPALDAFVAARRHDPRHGGRGFAGTHPIPQDRTKSNGDGTP